MVLLTVSGFILGGIVTYYFIPSGFSSPGRPPWSPRSEIRQAEGPAGGNAAKGADEKETETEKRNRFLNMWKEKLDLSQEQEEQFHLIFDAGHQKFIDASEASRERFAQIRIETDKEINKVLNPEQAAKYREIVEAHRIRREKEAGNQMKSGKGQGNK